MQEGWLVSALLPPLSPICQCIPLLGSSKQSSARLCLLGNGNLSFVAEEGGVSPGITGHLATSISQGWLYILFGG